MGAARQTNAPPVGGEAFKGAPGTNGARATDYTAGTTLTIAIVEFAADTSTGKRHDIGWPDLARRLTKHDRRPQKDGRCWLPVTFKPGGTRVDADVVEACALVLDVDKLPDDGAVMRVLGRVEDLDLAAAFHTTFSDREKNTRALRGAIPLSRPVEGARWREFYDAAANWLALPYEPKCSNPSRIWYLPACKPDAEPQSWIYEGAPLDVDTIWSHAEELAYQRAEQELVRESAWSIPPSFPDGRVAVEERARRYVDKMSPAISGSGGHTATLKVALVLVRGFELDTATAMTVMREFNLRCDPPWDERDLERKVDQAAKSTKVPLGYLLTETSTRSHSASVQTSTHVRQAVAVVDTTGNYGGDLAAFLGDDEPDEDPSLDYVVHGIIPRGAPFVIGGHPKQGKTLVVEDLAIAIAAGAESWCGFPVSPDMRGARVLLMPREDSARETRVRIWRLARGRGLDPRDLAGKLEVDGTSTLYLDDAALVAKLRRSVEAFDVVLIDSLQTIHRGDENSARDMAIVCGAWRDIALTTGKAVGLIHHFNGKGAEGDTRDPGHKLRGSSALFATARHVVGIERMKKPDSAIAVRVSGNLSHVPEPFAVRRVESTVAGGKLAWSYEPLGKLGDVRDPEVRDAVLAAVTNSMPDGIGSRDLRDVVRDKVDASNGAIDREALQLSREKRIGRASKRATWKLEGFVPGPSIKTRAPGHQAGPLGADGAGAPRGTRAPSPDCSASVDDVEWSLVPRS